MDIRAEHRQTQTLSPRLQHAVRLLQMSSLDFAAMVRDTLGKNPFLETEETDGADGIDADDSSHGDADDGDLTALPGATALEPAAADRDAEPAMEFERG